MWCGIQRHCLLAANSFLCFLSFFLLSQAFVVQQVLPRLAERRVWDSSVLFEGFVRCIHQTQPESFTVGLWGSPVFVFLLPVSLVFPVSALASLRSHAAAFLTLAYS